MAGYTAVEEYTNYYLGNLVESVTVRETDDAKYPSGWDYSLHFGSVEGDLIVRYDNAHERHTADGTEEFDFPGMFELLARFQREVTNYRDAHAATDDSEVR